SRGDSERGEKNEEEREGDEEVDQFRENRGERNDESRKIDFLNHSGIDDETGAGVGHRIGKVGPGDEGDEGENRVGNAVGRNAGEASENDRENDHRENRLDDRPADSEDGLGVADFDVAPDEEVKQVAVSGEFLEVDQLPAAFRFDDVVWSGA